jgi:D-alanyl-D-alanine dipeptidase
MVALVEVKHERFVIELLYATSHHLLNRPVYKEYGLDKCYAHPELFACLLRTTDRLKELCLKLKIYDCYRPVAVQREMWKILPDARYVADPEVGSHHNRGVAVDCYLVREDGTPLEFPTAPDGYIPGIEKDFDRWMAYLKKAHPEYQCLPEEAEKCRNRDLLRSIMEQAGLIIDTDEWWHYELPNAYDYPLIENVA